MASWNIGVGGGDVLQTKKIGEGQLTTHEITLYPMENYINDEILHIGSSWTNLQY